MRKHDSEHAPPLRILWYWPHPFRSTNSVASALVDLGHEVVVECLSTFDGEVIERAPASYEVVGDLPDVSRDPVAWRRAARNVVVQLRRAWRRHRLARSLQPDVVFVETSFAPVDALTLRVLVRRGGPVVMQVHDVIAHQGSVPPFLDRLVRASTYRNASRLVTLHEDVATELVARFPSTKTKVDVVEPVLVPYDVPQPVPQGDGRRHLLLFGSLRPNKGIDTLLQALRSIAEPAFDVIVSGPADPVVAQRLRAASSELPNLTFKEGFADAQERIDLYRWSDVVLLPYSASYRSSSGVVRDAQQFGRAVIASDVGSIGREVRRYDMGWLVPPDDATALAQAMLDAVGHPDRVRAFARNARRSCDDHTGEQTARLLESLYQRMSRRA